VPALTTSREAVRDAWLGAQRSPNTVDAYRRDTDQWFEWLDSHGYDWRAATRLEVDRYRHWLRHQRRRGGPVSEATVGRKLTSLSSFYGYVVLDLELLGRNPVARVMRSARDDRPLTVAMSLDEAHRFTAAAKAEGPMPHALIQTMLSTGIRVSGACTATVDDLGMDRDHHVLTVRLKGGRRQRLPLVPAAWDALQVNLDGRRSGALFLAQRVPLYRQEAYRIVRRVAAAADIPEKHITPHGLRRTAATILLDAGESTRAVQHMLGHRDPKTTMLYDGGRLDIDDSPVHTLGELLERTSP